MLTLINANRMAPAIAPVGLDYVAGAARQAGIDVELVDLCLAGDAHAALAEYLGRHSPELIGVSFRNVDDCFWPGASWFVPGLAALVAAIRRHSDAPIVLGGVGYSIFARRILDIAGADFGIRGDGEEALVALVGELRGARRFEKVAGLLWREGWQGQSQAKGGWGRAKRCPSGSALGLHVFPPRAPASPGASQYSAPGTRAIHENPAAWPSPWSAPATRDVVDNPTYFRRGGQIGVETRRGCPRKCLYCADPLAKGAASRLRSPVEVALEFESLAAQGIDVFHLCDSEFNIPIEHARAVCDELNRRRLGERVRWYAYLAVLPFDADLARPMRRAGCVGINFTGDSASAAMLATYGQPHRRDDLSAAVRLCRAEGIAVMFDLLLGGPGETPESAAETVDSIRRIGPDCAGAALGVRLYPQTGMIDLLAAEGPLETNPAIHRRYEGPIDLVRPTFYVSAALGRHPARLVRELIGGDERFFAPVDEEPTPGPSAAASTDHNYNDNRALVEAIAAGARGAYWDILRKLRDR